LAHPTVHSAFHAPDRYASSIVSQPNPAAASSSPTVRRGCGAFIAGLFFLKLAETPKQGHGKMRIVAFDKLQKNLFFLLNRQLCNPPGQFLLGQF
jgi:hypothetical protein